MGRRKRNVQGSLVKQEDEDLEINDKGNNKFPRTDRSGGAESLDMFQVMANAAIEGYLPIEQIIELCYAYGVTHGEALSKKFTNKAYLRNLVTNGALSSSGSRKDTNPEDSHQNGRHNPSLSTKTNMDPPAPLPPLPPMESIENSQTYKLKNGYQVESSTSNAVPEDTFQSVVPVQKYKGVAIASETFSRRLQISRYQAFLPYNGKTIVLGDYETPEEAAQAHDRAMIRILGPMNCEDKELNFSMRNYAKDPLEKFTIFDKALKHALFGTTWKGLQDCDFSYLVLSIPTFQDIQKMRAKNSLHSTNGSSSQK